MFTPQEVREQSESFEKAVFGGYSVSAVDDFVGSLAEDYAALYKENAVLKSKMKVLVERLEEYRKQEDSLNKVMLSAQQSADELVQDAERKCAKMLSDTEASLRERNVDLKRELAAEAERVSRAKKTAAAFIAEMENQVHQSLSQLERIRQMTIVPKASAKQPVSQKPEPAPKPNPAPQKPDPKPEPVLEPETPEKIDPSEITRQIELNLSKILEGDGNAKTPAEDVSGDTMVMKPLG